LLPSYIPLHPHLPSNHYNIEKTVLLIINEFGKKGGEKKWVSHLHLPSNHYKFEMTILPYFGVLRDFTEKVITGTACQTTGWYLF